MTEELIAMARAGTLQRQLPPAAGGKPPPLPGSPAGQDLITRLSLAYESGDVDAIVALLTAGVWVTMPPAPLQYQGRELARRFLATVAFRRGRAHRLVPTGANGQPAFGVYLLDPRRTQRNGLMTRIPA